MGLVIGRWCKGDFWGSQPGYIQFAIISQAEHYAFIWIISALFCMHIIHYTIEQIFFLMIKPSGEIGRSILYDKDTSTNNW